MTGTPRIVTLILLVAGLAAANRVVPGMVQAVLLLVALYLVVTHSGKVSVTLNRAAGGFARSFGAA